MKNLNTKTDAQESWESERLNATELMGNAEQQGADVLDFGDTNFLNYVELKRSFHEQAIDMVKWITKELSKDHGLVEDYAYFMDKGYTINKPDRWDYRSAVFGDLKEAIQNNSDYDVYEIVQKWDMWYHS